jgi:hypothetical protein
MAGPSMSRNPQSYSEMMGKEAEEGSTGSQWKRVLKGLEVALTGSPATMNPQRLQALWQTLQAPMNIGENIAARTVDPTGALGKGSVLNPESNRPMDSDPNVRSYVGALLPGALGPQPGMGNSIADLLRSGKASKSGASALPNVKKVPKLTKKQAQAFIDQVPEARYSIDQQVRAARRDDIAPLIGERRQLHNARGTTSAGLAKQKTDVQQNLRASLESLNAQSEAAKELVTKRANFNVQEFINSVGSEMRASQLAKGSQQTRAKAFRDYTDQVGTIYDGVRDDVFPNNITFHETGEKIPTGIFNSAGEEILKAETIPIEGAINLSKVKEALKSFADRYAVELAEAIQNQSPGARAVMNIVNGPDVVPGAAAIDNLKALNNLGYGKADRVFRTSGEAISRKAGAAYREALKESIGKMKGGEQALKDLEKAAKLLDTRNRLLVTGDIISTKPIARRAAEAVEAGGGNIIPLTKNPVKFKAYWDQVKETPLEAGFQRQIANDLLGSSEKVPSNIDGVLGKGYQEFKKRWYSMNQEVKEMVFTPQQIEAANRVADEGPKALRELADEAIQKNSMIIEGSVKRLKELADKRSQLADLPKNVRELNTKIEKERLSIRELSESQRLRLDQQIREANKRIKEIQAFRKKMMWGAALALGGGTVYGNTRSMIGKLMNW